MLADSDYRITGAEGAKVFPQFDLHGEVETNLEAKKGRADPHAPNGGYT